MPHNIAISIINYRTGDLTIGCVQSVLAALDGVDGHVVVIDNASGDGSAAQIADWLAGQPAGTPVTLVRSETNSGFSGGHNQGIQAVDAELYLLLNSDAVVRPDILHALLAAAKAHPEAGLIAPRIETEEGAPQVSCFRYHSPASEFIRGAGSGPVTKMLAGRVVALDPVPDPAQIEWASFACILLRRAMIDQVGLMDEGYFLYFEDAEYCLRARRAGWQIAYAPEAVAVHFRGGSGPVKALNAARKRLPAYYYRSRTRFFRQAHGPSGPLRANLAWYAGRALTQLRRMIGKSVHPPVTSEARDIWINFLSPLRPDKAPER